MMTSENAWARPVVAAGAAVQGVSRPVRGTDKVVVTGTGFSKPERDELRHAVSLLGARYLPDLVHCSTSPHCHTTHLVCKTMLDAFGTPKYTRCVHAGGAHACKGWHGPTLRPAQLATMRMRCQKQLAPTHVAFPLERGSK